MQFSQNYSTSLIIPTNIQEIFAENARKFADAQKILAAYALQIQEQIAPVVEQMKKFQEARRLLASSFSFYPSFVDEDVLVVPKVEAKPIPVEGDQILRRSIFGHELPPRTTWGHITLRFLNYNDVEISVKGTLIRCIHTFETMGFMDKRTRNPDLQWQLLIKFAEFGADRLDWSCGKDKITKRKQRLNEKLQLFFGLKEKPITDYRETSGYVLLINLVFAPTN